MDLNTKKELNEKETLTDLLSSQKFMTGVYNSDLLESATPEVKHLFLGILRNFLCRRVISRIKTTEQIG